MFGRLFGWSKAKKCKTLLKMVVSRIRLLRERRRSLMKQLKQDIYQLFLKGFYQSAFDRVELLYKENNQGEVHEMLEKFCECLLEKIPYIRAHKDLPDDIKEVASSLIYAAARCGALPELQRLRELFGKRYGQEFVSASVESRSGSSVNEQLIETLSTKLPDSSTKLVWMKQIAQEYNLPWDSIIEEQIYRPSEKKSTKQVTLSTKQDALVVKSPQLESPIPGGATLSTKHDSLEVSAPRLELTIHGGAMIRKDKPSENQNASLNEVASTVEVFDRDISVVTGSVKEVKQIVYNDEHGMRKLINSSNDNSPETKCRDTAAIPFIDKGRASMEDSYGDSAISSKTNNVSDNNDKNSITSEDSMLTLNMKPLYDNYSSEDSSSTDKTRFPGSRGEIRDSDACFELKISKRDKKFQRHRSVSHKARRESGINTRNSRFVQQETSDGSSPGDYRDIYLNTSLETEESDYLSHQFAYQYSPTVKSRKTGDQRKRRSVSGYSTIESGNDYSENRGRDKTQNPYSKNRGKEHHKKQGEQINVEARRHSINTFPSNSVSISKDISRRNSYEMQPPTLYSDSTDDCSQALRHLDSKRERELDIDEVLKEATVAEKNRRVTNAKAFIHQKHKGLKGRGREPEFVETKSFKASSRCSSRSPGKSPKADKFSRQVSLCNPRDISDFSPTRYHRTNTDNNVLANRQQRTRTNLSSKLHKQADETCSIYEDYSYLPNFENVSKNSQRTRSYKQSKDVYWTDEAPTMPCYPNNPLPKDCKGRNSHTIVSRTDRRINEDRAHNHKFPNTKLKIFEADFSHIRTQHSRSASRTSIDIEMVEENKGMTKQRKNNSSSRSRTLADYAADEESDSPRKIEVSDGIVRSSPAHPSKPPLPSLHQDHQQIHTKPASPGRFSVASPKWPSLSSTHQWQRVVSLPVQRSGASPVRRSPRATSFDDKNGRVSYSSLQSPRSPHVHPKLPEYDDLAATFVALKQQHASSSGS